MASSTHRGVAVTIQFKQSQVDQLTQELRDIKNGVPKALAGVINRQLPKVRTEAVNGLSDVLTAKKGSIRKMPSGTDRITIVKASPTKLEGLVKILTRPIGLVNFRHLVRRGAGFVVQIFKNGPQVHLRHVFKRTGRSGNVHLFQRQRRITALKAGGASQLAITRASGFVGRLPIESMKGPSLLTVYRKHPEIHKRIEARLDADMQKEIDSQIARFTKRPIRKT